MVLPEFLPFMNESHDVNERLAELHLNQAFITEIRDRVLAARRDATPDDAATARGLKGYLEGVRALRECRHLFLGEYAEFWQKGSFSNIEFIENSVLNIKLVFYGVDEACNEKHMPQPNPKGSASRAFCANNLAGKESEDLLGERKGPDLGTGLTYQLLIDAEGRAELSRFTIDKSGHFADCGEPRLFILERAEIYSPDVSVAEEEEIPQFEPAVKKR